MAETAEMRLSDTFCLSIGNVTDTHLILLGFFLNQKMLGMSPAFKLKSRAWLGAAVGGVGLSDIPSDMSVTGGLRGGGAQNRRFHKLPAAEGIAVYVRRLGYRVRYADGTRRF